jgi:hypothetical protein
MTSELPDLFHVGTSCRVRRSHTCPTMSSCCSICAPNHASCARSRSSNQAQAPRPGDPRVRHHPRRDRPRRNRSPAITLSCVRTGSVEPTPLPAARFPPMRPGSTGAAGIRSRR